MENYSQLRSATLNHIMRQKPEAYRLAIADIASGRIADGFVRLDRIGAIVQMVPGLARYRQLAEEFTESIKRGKSALAVAPTWREIGEVTEEIRQRLKTEKLLSRAEHTMEVHESLDWTEAQRRDARNYRPGLIVTFHRSTNRFAAGEWARVTEVVGEKIYVRKANGQTEIVTKKQAKCFGVAQSKELSIAPGERLLIQQNRRRSGLINGQIVTVRRVDRQGRIWLSDGRVIGRGFRSFTHGYCVTSHGAEGKTVDHVFLAASSSSFRAAHREQFYVSVSRGRYRVRVFTDDREGLLAAVKESAARLSAVELVQGIKPRVRVNATYRTTNGAKHHVAP